MALFGKKTEQQILDYDGNRIYINGLLLNHPQFKLPKSLITGANTTYDLFAEELTEKFISKKLSKKISETETINKCKEINETLVFALNNLANIPSTLRDYFFGVVDHYSNFLKQAASFPELDTVSDQITSYIPLLKELTLAIKTFLINNK